MSALKDKTVSVPIEPSDVTETLRQLPRTPTEARLAVVQLKRRLNYPGVHSQQLIDVKNVKKALRTFMEMKNPYYASIAEDNDFKQRCRETDPEGFKILFPNEEIDLSGLEINSQKSECGIDLEGLEIDSQKCGQEPIDSKNDEPEEKEENVEEEYLLNDPIAKNQFNYNRSTCFGNNHPRKNSKKYASRKRF